MLCCVVRADVRATRLRCIEEDERDPLDSVDFDPVDYLNDHFPDESAFASNLDGFIAGLNAKIQQSEYQMYQAIRQQVCILMRFMVGCVNV